MRVGDGTSRTVRSRIQLGQYGAAIGVDLVVVLDDCKLAVVASAHHADPYRVYVPSPQGLGAVRDGVCVLEGRSAWISGHLPTAPNTVAELPWRIIQTREGLALILYRAAEPIVLTQVGVLDRTRLFGKHLIPTEDHAPLQPEAWSDIPAEYGEVGRALPLQPIR